MRVDSIAEQLFFTTVRIESDFNSGVTSVGTGFIFAYENSGTQYSLVVTNKHVVAGSVRGRMTFLGSVDGKPAYGSGKTITINDFQELWHGHPNDSIDVAVAPLGPAITLLERQGFACFFRSIGSELIPGADVIEGLDALEEVIFIGYPNGIWDKANLLPVARKGITATPLSLDFDGDKKFLVDASVFPGSSGSPVFLYNAGMYYDKAGTTNIGTRLLFLGIISEVYFMTDKDILTPLLPTVASQEQHSIQMINLGIVYKSSAVLETIEGYLQGEGVVLDKSTGEGKSEA